MLTWLGLGQLCFSSYINISHWTYQNIRTTAISKVIGSKPFFILVTNHTCRIFQGTATNRWFSLATWFLIGVASIWTISFFFASLFECKAISDNWYRYGAPEGRCIDENLMYLVQAWSDTITDCKPFRVRIKCLNTD